MKTTLTIPSYDDIDIHDLLAQRRMVAILWSVEDVQSIRPGLSNDQAWEVLANALHEHDCELGFTWSLIETVADLLFPQPEN